MPTTDTYHIHMWIHLVLRHLSYPLTTLREQGLKSELWEDVCNMNIEDWNTRGGKLSGEGGRQAEKRGQREGLVKLQKEERNL